MTDYYPWDPLQLTDDIDGGWRANPYDVSFKIFSSLHKHVKVYNVYDISLSTMFYGNNEEYLRLIRKISRLSHELTNFNVNIYDLAQNNDFTKESLIVEKKNYGVKYIKYPENMLEFFKEYEKFVTSLQTKYNEIGKQNFRNKKIHLSIIHVDPNQLKILKEDPGFSTILENITNKTHLRVHLIILTKDYTFDCPSQLLRKSDWVSFVNEDNIKSAEKFYGKERNAESIYERLYGVVKYKNDELNSIHRLKRQGTEYKASFMKELRDSDNAYKEFLAKIEENNND